MTALGHAPGLPVTRGLTLGDFLVPSALIERAPAWARDAILVAGGVLLLTIGAHIAFELPTIQLGRLYVPENPYVPITLQTFGVLFSSALLGTRRALAATGIYLLIGAIGLPVFSFGQSGSGMFASLEEGRVVLGTTGGYLLGFLVASAIVGGLAERGWDRRIGGSIGAMVIGTLVIYAFGITWLAAAIDVSIIEALPFGLYPFLPGDILKLLVAAGLLPLGWRLVARRASDRPGRSVDRPGGSPTPG